MTAQRGRPFKIGVQLPEVEWVAPWTEIKAMAQTAEAIGLDSVWFGEHLLYHHPGTEPRGPWECWTMMAAVAAVTERVEIGPLVACTNFHNPAHLAKMAATLDEICGGRLILGLGAGWYEHEYRAYGFPYDHRVSRFEEAFTIIRTLLREGEIDFEGEYYSARDCILLPHGPRPNGPPIMVGSFGERMLKITLPHADSWNAWFADFGETPERLKELLAKIDTACESAGRDPKAVERTAAIYVQLPGGKGRSSGDAQMAPSIPITGTPEEIATGLRAYDGLGLSHIQIVLDPITVDAIERLAPVLEVLDRG
jgi:alkanesulfonate monooxygenase SsuD/methylene tetrahydromethanopterin reductase-like flavin-dependent oxidoreductase (luciferase family)